MQLSHNNILNADQRFRANFINSLGGFKSVVLVGTKSVQGNENLSIVSSLFHLGANPALCGFIIRPNEEKQNTLGNIVATGSYTINHILPSFYKQAHQCSAKYDEGVSEFEQVGLTPEYTNNIDTPFVRESRIKFACKLVQKIDIELNGAFLILGQIVAIEVPDQFVGKDGYIDLEQAETVTTSGLDAYHITQKIARLSYAKTNQAIKEI